MHTGAFDRDQVWRTENQAAAPTGVRWRWVRYGAVGLSVVGAFFVGNMLGSAPVAGLKHTNQALSAEVADLKHELWNYVVRHDRCATYDTDTPRVSRLIAKGEYREAAAIADLDLSSTTMPVCPGSALSAAWYTARMDALFSTPVSSPLDQTPVLTWEAIEKRATALGLGMEQRLSPLTVFTYAYDNQIWQLARASFDAAVEQQLVATSDLLSITKYFATLRNEGHALAFSSSGHSREAGQTSPELGLRIAATSVADE